MSGAGAQERGSDSPSEQAGSSVRVKVENEVVQIVSMSGEMEELRHFSRSTTLMDMRAAAGTSALPITHSGINLWQEAVDLMLKTETWHLHRTLELVQVSEYLNDKETLDWAISSLAQAVDSAVRAKYKMMYIHKHKRDASVCRQLLSSLDIGSGVRLANLSDTERRAVAFRLSNALLHEADRHLLSSCKTQALSLMALPLCLLVPQLPPDLMPALLRRHMSHGVLDISNQLRLLEHDSRCTRFMQELAKELPLNRLGAELRALCPLTGLNVSDNNLNSGDASPLATCFESCASELQTLTISKNTDYEFLTAVLPSLTACPALTCLNLSGCIRYNRSRTGFTALARLLRGLGALQELDMSGNALRCDNLACIVASALLLPALHTLRLDSSSVAMRSPVRPSLSDPCSYVQEWFELYHKEVQSTGSVHVGGSEATSCVTSGDWLEQSVLPKSQGPCLMPYDRLLEQMQVNAARMESEGSYSTPPDFKSMRCGLRELYLSNMRGVGIDWLMHVATVQMAWKEDCLRKVGLSILGESKSSLPAWEIVRAQDAPNDALQGEPFKSPWSLVAMLENLEILDISDPGRSCKHPFTGTNSPCEFIFQLPKLRDLRARRLDEHKSFCLTEICEGLSLRLQQQSIVGLTALDWSENPVWFGALRAVCTISTLHCLVLQGCSIGMEGATALAEHVSQLTVLHTLDLADNKLTGAGVAALMHGASNLSSLKVVDVGGGSEAVQAVAALRSAGVLGDGMHVSCTAHTD